MADKETLTRAERIMLRISVIQTVLAVVGFFVGGIALYAALVEADAVRKQQKAAVWPHVEISPVNENSDPNGRKTNISISNKGIGPAKIVSLYFTIDNEPAKSWWDFLLKIEGDDRESVQLSNKGAVNIVLSPNERYDLFSLDVGFYKDAEPEIYNRYNRLLDQLREALSSGRIGLYYCYCSVFDECWEADSNSNAPGLTLTKNCRPQPEGSRF